MSENSPAPHFSAKKFYIFVAIGLIIFAAGTLFAYSAKHHLDDKSLPAEDQQREERIYAAAKIASMIGFIIALIPSVQILQHTIQKERENAQINGQANKQQTNSQANSQTNGKSSVDTENEIDIEKSKK